MTNASLNLLMKQTRTILSLEEAAMGELASLVHKPLGGLTISPETCLVKNVPLAELLKKWDVTRYGEDDPTPDIPLAIYLLVYIRLYKDRELSGCRMYADFKKCFLLYAEAEMAGGVFHQLCHCCLVYMIVKEGIHGDVLFSEYDVIDWPDVAQLGQILPFVRISPGTVLAWLSELAKQYRNDGGLQEVARYVHEWAIQKPEDSSEIEQQLTHIAKNRETSLFLAPLLSAMKEVHRETTRHYVELLTPVIDADNSYTVLYALGIISNSDEGEREQYYQILLANRKSGQLDLVSFVDLCRMFRFFRSELLQEIDSGLPGDNDGRLMGAIILLLLATTDEEIDKQWKWEVSRTMMANMNEAVHALLTRLLTTTATVNLPRAYDLLEHRMKAGGSLKKMDDAIRFMASRDVALFQERLVNWLTTEDDDLHLGVLSVCSAVHTQAGYFAIPGNRLAGLTHQDKAYMVYKVAGYIYSMEPLQWLIISVAKSTDPGNAALREVLFAILDDYVIYNYRSTLDILRKEVADTSSNTEFSRSLFKELIERYERYFLSIAGISLEKELAAYKEDMLLKNFYGKKQFVINPDEIKNDPMTRFVKKTTVNSDRWAVRRPGEWKHDPQPLNTYSMKFEWPSGEKLNPVYQEHMRRSYQKLRKHEINID